MYANHQLVCDRGEACPSNYVMVVKQAMRSWRSFQIRRILLRLLALDVHLLIFQALRQLVLVIQSSKTRSSPVQDDLSLHWDLLNPKVLHQDYLPKEAPQTAPFHHQQLNKPRALRRQQDHPSVLALRCVLKGLNVLGMASDELLQLPSWRTPKTLFQGHVGKLCSPYTDWFCCRCLYVCDLLYIPLPFPSHGHRCRQFYC